jgi:hypothetical protein
VAVARLPLAHAAEEISQFLGNADAP